MWIRVAFAYTGLKNLTVKAIWWIFRPGGGPLQKVPFGISDGKLLIAAEVAEADLKMEARC